MTESRRPPTILLVEDEAIVAAVEVGQLEEAGYVVLHAADGRKAMEAVRSREGAVDLILMDIDLGPGMDGTQAAREILKEYDLPILFLSSHTEEDIVARTEPIASFGYVVKDSGPIVLAASIKMAFKLHKSQRELMAREAARARMEEALRESEERYRQLVDNAPIPIIVHQSARVVFANPAALAFAGTSDPADVIGRAFMDFVHLDFRDIVLRRIQAMASEKVAAPLTEEIFLRLDGSPVDVEVTRALISYRGQPADQVMFRDISKRKRGEEKYRIIEAALQSSLSATGLAGLDGRFTYVNPAFIRLWGYDDEKEVLGRHVSEFAFDKELFNEGLMSARMGKEIIGEGLAQKRNGDSFPVQYFANLVTAPDGRPLCLRASFIDITERKRAEAALKQSELTLRRKLDDLLSPGYSPEDRELADIIKGPEIQALMDDFYAVTHIGMAIIDLKGGILVATGWQDICTKFHRIQPETRRNCIESDTILSRQAKPGEYFTYKCRNQMWDMATPIMAGKKHIGNLFLGQFFFDDEIPDYAEFSRQAETYGFDKAAYLAALDRVPRWSRAKVKSAMDFYARLAEMISALSYANLTLAKSLLDQKILTAQREILLKELQHRVKNSLTVVSSLLGLEKEKLTDPHCLEVFVKTRARIRSMSAIYEKLYLSADLENVELAPYIVDLAETLLGAYELKSGDVRIRTHLDDVRIDTKRALPLGLILNELITNALKYAYPAGSQGEIRIDLKKTDGMIELSVADDGAGWPPDFDPQTTDSMGWNLIRLLAGQIDGEISASGKAGSRVTLRLKL
jgi:PAS domain S-box-containing protein